MQWLIVTLLMLLGATPTLGQNAKIRPARADVEFRTSTTGAAGSLEIQIPDVASGRSQKRAITDLMLRVSLPRGDIEAALRLPNNTNIDRDEGLFRAHVYVVSGGRLLHDAEARCDRWVEDFAVCKMPCEGGAFGLKRRPGQGPIILSLVAGRLPRGFEDGSKLGFSIAGCSDGGSEPEMLLAPSGGRAIIEVPLKAR
jgi:hypothetical protein